MTTRRLTMIKAREILRQKWVLERSHREVASVVFSRWPAPTDLRTRRRNARPISEVVELRKECKVSCKAP